MEITKRMNNNFYFRFFSRNFQNIHGKQNNRNLLAFVSSDSDDDDKTADKHDTMIEED